MLSEIFPNPKPILGTIHLLPLPGSTAWNGRHEPVFERAEQEALALSSGGVSGLILENFYDTPHRLDRIDPAGAIAMALIAKRVIHLTSLPLGISVLGNDPETALAIATNVGASFIRVPVLVGSIVTDIGLAEGRLQSLGSYKNLLKPLASPKILVDVTLNHLVPGRIQSLIGGPQKGFVPTDFLINHLRQVALSVEKHDFAHGLILSGYEVTPEIVEALKTKVSLPILVEDPRLEILKGLHEKGDGMILSHAIKKQSTTSPWEGKPTVDMAKVEERVLLLHPQECHAFHPGATEKEGCQTACADTLPMEPSLPS